MIPPANALTHKNAICTATRQKAASGTQSATRAHLTVTLQLAMRASSSACRGLLQASDQKEPEGMMRLQLGE
jgi:hypothetical protein